MKVRGQNNNRCWFIKYPSDVCEVPEHDIQVHVWCAVECTQSEGSCLSKKQVLIILLLFRDLEEEEMWQTDIICTN
jgi:hypothetical protein